MAIDLTLSLGISLNLMRCRSSGLASVVEGGSRLGIGLNPEETIGWLIP